MDSDQTTLTGAVCSGSTQFVDEASKTYQQTKFVVIGAFRVKSK